jgi:uncharacterized protein
MATIGPQGEPGAAHGSGGAIHGDGEVARSPAELAVAEDHAGWVSRSRVFLTPIAAPSIMGLFGLMIALLMYGAWQAGWYGSAVTPLFIWPFVLFVGVLQAVAAIVSLRARDGVAVATHTAWGSFFIAWGVLQLLVTAGRIPLVPLGTPNSAMAFWFIALALVTVFTALGALAQDMGTFATLGILFLASAVTAAGHFAGSLPILRAGGWLFVIAAVAAWLTAGAMMLEHSYGRTILPRGMLAKRQPYIPGPRTTDQLAYPAGMPGVRVGQ